jgi:hypothetical protein
MPSSKEKRAQRHQSQPKQQTGRFANRTKTTEQIAGVGYRETQLIGGRKFYTSLSNDPNEVLGNVESSVATRHGGLTGLENDNHPQYLLVDGTRAMTGNLNMGSQSITSVTSITASNDISIGDALDVDGPTTLDKTTINTTDGAFAVTGTNQITLTTTSTANDGTGNLDVNVGFNYELDVQRGCDWNTGSVDWDNSGGFALTSLGNTTIETLGTTSSPRTLSLTGGLSDFSKYGLVAISSFIQSTEDGDTTDNQGANGIHIKCDAGDVAAKNNNIFIEQKNQNQKGNGYGINLRSSNGVKIQTINTSFGHPTSIIMEAPASGSIDIGLGTVQPSGSPSRVRVHGVFETSSLYRAVGSIITTDIGTANVDSSGNPGTATGLYTQFEAINTFNLLRAMTHKASATVKGTNIGTSHVSHSSYSDTDPYDGTDGTLRIVPPGGTGVNHDDNQTGTVWMVTVFFHYGSSNPNLQVYWCYASSSSTLNKIRVVNALDSTHFNQNDPHPDLDWNDTTGIYWINEDNSDATVRASALKIQGASDF